MRHLLSDPAFPDIVGEWAAEQAREELQPHLCANDNHGAAQDALSDPLTVARRPGRNRGHAPLVTPCSNVDISIHGTTMDHLETTEVGNGRTSATALRATECSSECSSMPSVSSVDSSPRRGSTEPQARPFWQALAIDLGLLGLFAVQHSVMARPAFKRWWTHFVPEAVERSTYVLLSSLALVALFIWWQPIGGIVWNVPAGLARGSVITLYLLGWALLLYTTFLIDHFDLFGLKQVWRRLRGPCSTSRRNSTRRACTKLSATRSTSAG